MQRRSDGGDYAAGDAWRDSRQLDVREAGLAAAGARAETRKLRRRLQAVGSGPGSVD